MGEFENITENQEQQASADFKKRSWFSQHWLAFVSVVVTCVFMLAMYFPVYWLLVSSTKDNIEANKNPPSLWFKLPQDYTIYLDSTGVEDYTEDEFKCEALVTAWMISDRKMALNLNSVTVAWVSDGTIHAKAKLKYTTYQNIKGSGEVFVGSVAQKLIKGWKNRGNEKYDRLLSIMSEDGYSGNLSQKIPNSYSKDSRAVTLIEYLEKVTDASEQTITESERITLKTKVLGITTKGNFGGLFNNFRRVLTGTSGFFRNMLNSAYIAVVQIILNVVVSAMAAYSLSFLIKNKKIKNLIVTIFLAVIAIPGIVKQVPLYTMIKGGPLNDTYLAIWLPGIFSPVNILLMKVYMDQLAKDLCDAAKIDGANETVVFTRIVVPLSLPVFGAVAITSFTGSWNDFFWPNLILETKSKFTFVQIIQNAMSITSGGVRDYTVALAMSLIACIPTLPIYALMQKQLKRGLMLGGLKG